MKIIPAVDIKNGKCVRLSQGKADQETICEGETITFTINGTDLGNNPTYQWQIDGANTGNNSPIFSTNILSEGQNITCTINTNQVCAISDQHGHLPEIPPCDLFLVAGDLCPTFDHSLSFQEGRLDTNFKYWLRDVDAKCKIFICGNHDFIGEEKPQTLRKIFKDEKNTHYFQCNDYRLSGIHSAGR